MQLAEPISSGVNKLDRYREYETDDSGENLSDEFGIHRNPLSDTLLLVFSGMMIEKPEGREISPRKGLFKQLTRFRTNIIFFRNRDRNILLGGVPELADSYEGTLREIRKLKDSMNVRRIVTLGMSAGGYSALLYGLDLNAEKILCFGTITTLEEEMYAHEKRGRATTKFWRKQFPERVVDFRTALKEHPTPPKIDLHYAELHEFDRRHAEYLAGMPSVTLHPIIGSADHSVMSKLREQNKLLDIFTNFLVHR